MGVLQPRQQVGGEWTECYRCPETFRWQPQKRLDPHLEPSRMGSIAMSLLERLPQAVRHEGGLSRRLFVAYGAALAALPAIAARSAGTTDSKISFAADPFQLGVASGDPDAHSVVLWTRLCPKPLEPGYGLTTERKRQECDSRFADAALTAAGIRQAEQRRAEIEGWQARPALIVTSPLLRAIQTTAHIFADALSRGVPLVVRPELREFFPNLASSAGRPLPLLRGDPAIRALPNADVILAALSDEACAGWRENPFAQSLSTYANCGGAQLRHDRGARRPGPRGQLCVGCHPAHLHGVDVQAARARRDAARV